MASKKSAAVSTKTTILSTQKAAEKPARAKPARRQRPASAAQKPANETVKEPTRKPAKTKPARRQRPASAAQKPANETVKEPTRKPAKTKPARRQRPASAAQKPANETVKEPTRKPAKTKPARRQRPASAAQKPAKGPVKTKEEARSEFEEAWKDYSKALDTWKEAIAWWYDATNRSLVTYRVACQKALETDSEALKKVSVSWQNTWEIIGPTYIKQQTSMIENIFGNTNIEKINGFNEQWERFLKTSGSDSIAAYQEAIKRFNQAWVMS